MYTYFLRRNKNDLTPHELAEIGAYLQFECKFLQQQPKSVRYVARHAVLSATCSSAALFTA